MKSTDCYERPERMPVSAALFTAFLCALFGANAVAIKFSFAGIGIYTTAAIRFTVAALTLFLWANLTNRPLAIKRDKVVKILILTLLFVTQISLFYGGLSRTTASHGTLIGNLLPFVVLVLAHFFIPGDTITKNKSLGIMLGFAGVVLLLFDDLNTTNKIAEGDFMILLAVLIWGINGVFVKNIIGSYHPIQITFYPILIGAPFFFIEGLLWDQPMVRYFDTTILYSLMYQSIITASFGLVAWNTLLKKFGATSLHSFIFIMPISGVFFGVLLQNDPLTPNLLVSILMIAAGLIIVHRKNNS